MTETNTMSMPTDGTERQNNSQPKKKKVDDPPLPPDLGLKPVQLQRRRVWRACESCRRKKIKCDGNEPTCSQCAASKSQCTWLQTKDRAALSRHYVQELEARLQHMEGLFQQISPLLEQIGQATGLDVSGLASNSGTPGQATLPPNLLQAILNARKDVSAAPTRSSSPTQVKTEDDMSESFGQLALDEHGQMRWIGSSSTMSLIQSFRTLTTSPMHRVSPMEEDPLAPGPSVNKLYFPASVFFGKVRVLPGPEEVEWPPRDLADKLVDAYFSRFHFLMPIIDKTSFLRRYVFLMENLGDKSIAREQTPFLSLVNGVFACAAKLVDDPRLSNSEGLDESGMGMVYYERALILHYICHSTMLVEHVQCFLLMASFLCSVNCLPQAWILVGQAVRIAQDIGLHRSPRRLVIDSIEKETRRKVWWGCYILDRMLALALGRPLGIDDKDCDVELPVDVEDDNLPEYFAGANMSRSSPSLMKGFIEQISLYSIGGKVLRQVYSLDKCKEYLEPEKRAELNRSVESLDKALDKWCDELPVVFKSSPVTDKQVSMAAVLCTHYYSILTTLHRNFLPVKPDQPVLPRSTAKAVSTARACLRLAPSIRNVVPPSHHMAFFIQTLFSSAVIILLYAMHTTDTGAARTAMDEARSCLGFLENWEGSWPGARKCKELLEDLIATTTQAIRAAMDNQARMPPTATSSNPSSSSTPQSMPSGNGTPSPMPGNAAMAAPMNLPSGRIPVKDRAARRNRSRDPRLSPRLIPQSGYHRHDPLSQRARSTSRKRPMGDDDFEYGNPSLSSVLSGSYPGRSTLSAHSSPVSVNSHPSPPTKLEPPLEASPQMVPMNSFNMNPQSPTVQIPQSSQFQAYDYGLPQSPRETNWTSRDANNTIYEDPSQSSNGYQYMRGANDPGLVSNQYMDQLAEMGQNLSILAGSPPQMSGFAGPGLPFRGLDFIRNYTPGGYPMPNDDGLWQTLDPDSFLDPQIPFTFGDMPPDGQDGQQQWSGDGQAQ